MYHKHNTYVVSCEDTLYIHKNVRWNVSLPVKKQTNISSTFIEIRYKNKLTDKLKIR